MNYPFQFGTVFTLMSVQTSRTLGNENLFYAIFGSLMDLISGNRFKPPGSDSISRMKTGKRKISAPLAKKCRLYNAEEIIEKDIRKSVIKQMADVPQLIFQIIRLVREDQTYTAEARTDLLSYNPILEDNHAAYLAKAVIASVKIEKAIQFEEKAFVEHFAIQSPRKSPVGCTVPHVRPFFTGRLDEKAEIEKALVAQRVVFLYGPRGIGKSALAADFAASTKRFSEIIWLTYESSLQKTIESIYISGDEEQTKPTVPFERNSRWLKSLGQDTLVVLDNFDVLEEDEELFFGFVNFGFSLLVTSHVHHESCYEYEVEEMSVSDLKTLFYHYYRKNDLSDTQIEDLIDAAYRHTMVVEMTAKLMQNSNVSFETVVLELRSSVANLSLPVNVLLSKDGRTRNAIIKAHICALYDMCQLSHAQLRTMMLLSYMPVDGISDKLFSAWSEDQYCNTVTELHRMGWIDRSQYSQTLKVHPMVSEIIRSKNKEFYDDILQFSKKVVSYFKEKLHLLEETLVKVPIALANKFADFDADDWIVLQFENACCLQDGGRKSTALEIMQQISETRPDEIHSNYFSTYLYYRIGTLKMEMAQNTEALEDFEKALSFNAGNRIFEPSYCSLLANCLLECSLIFALQHKEEISDRFANFAKKLMLELPDNEAAKLQSRSLYKRGEIFRLQNKHRRALREFEKALEMRRKLYGEESLEAGLAHAQLGLSYRKMSDDFQAAKELYSAYVILEKLLPETHPNLISVQLSLGITLENITGKDLGIVGLLDYLSGVKSTDDVSDFADSLADRICDLLNDAKSLEEIAERAKDMKDLFAPAANSIKKLIAQFTKPQVSLMRKEYGWMVRPERFSMHNTAIPISSAMIEYMQNSGEALDLDTMKKTHDYHEKQYYLKFFHYVSDVRNRPFEILPNHPAGSDDAFWKTLYEGSKECLEGSGNTLWFSILSSTDLPLPMLPVHPLTE